MVPEWLACFEAWATASQVSDLSASIEQARTAYDAIADDIVEG